MILFDTVELDFPMWRRRVGELIAKTSDHPTLQNMLVALLSQIVETQKQVGLCIHDFVVVTRDVEAFQAGRFTELKSDALRCVREHAQERANG